MNIADIIVIILLAIIVGLAIRSIWKAKKNGSKCMGCSDCNNCSACKNKGL